MRIEKILKKPKGIHAINIKDEGVITIDSQIFIGSGLTEGMEVSREEIDEIIDKSNRFRIKQKAIWYISYRDHGKNEITQKLLKDFPEDLVEETVEKLCKSGLIDDTKFAENFARDQFIRKGLAERVIRTQLNEKGVDRELVDAAVEKVKQELNYDEREMIFTLIKRKHSQRINTEAGRKQAVNALIRSGHKWSDIKPALNRYYEEYGYPEDLKEESDE